MSNDEARRYVAERIQALIENPPPEKPYRSLAEEFATAKAFGNAAVNDLRALACKQTGMTLDELLEAERNVSHPKEFIPVAPSPAVVARRRMKNAGVPELFIQCVADKPPTECYPLMKVREHLDSHDGFLVLSGGKGTRKTGCAAWALGQVDRGGFVEALAVTRLSIEQRPTWDKLLAAEVVVLDDLGTERRDEKGAFIGAFFELFNGVYSGRKRLIITCNLSREQFAAEPERGGYGARVYDRLKETGKWAVVGGESVRGVVERQPGEDDE